MQTIMRQIPMNPGTRYGRLTVIAPAKSGPAGRRFLCRCDCGEERVVQACHLRSGHTRSCGCFKQENLPKKTADLSIQEGRRIVHGRDGRLYYFNRIVAGNKIGRPLRADEQAHHINEDKLDDRPENLEVLTISEHARLHRPRLTHCKRGHPFTEENSYWRSPGKRMCRTCQRLRNRAQYAKRKKATA